MAQKVKALKPISHFGSMVAINEYFTVTEQQAERLIAKGYAAATEEGEGADVTVYDNMLRARLVAEAELKEIPAPEDLNVNQLKQALKETGKAPETNENDFKKKPDDFKAAAGGDDVIVEGSEEGAEDLDKQEEDENEGGATV